MFDPLPQEVLVWRDSTVVRIAEAIVDKAWPADILILADALEEAGCPDGNLLAHCRRTDIPHTIFSPVLQTILGDPSTALDWCRAFHAVGLSTKGLTLSSRDFKKYKGEWLIPMVVKITPDLGVATLKKAGTRVWSWWGDQSLDALTKPQETSRRPEEGYVLAVRATVEADEENANLSQQDLLAQGHQGMRLEERLWLEAGYYETTTQHLDPINITLCPGSLIEDDIVPRVDWNPGYGGVRVHRCGVGYAHPCLRSRSARVLSKRAARRSAVARKAMA